MKRLIFTAKALITLGVLPQFLFIFSSFFLLIDVALGFCAPYEDLYSGDPICEVLGVYRLIYHVTIGWTWGIFLTLLILGLILGVFILFRSRNTFDVTSSEVQVSTRSLKWFLIIGLIEVLLAVQGAVINRAAEHKSEAALNSIYSNPEFCSIYVVDPAYPLSAASNKRKEWLEKVCTTKVLVKQIENEDSTPIDPKKYCILDVDDANNLSSADNSTKEFLIDAGCPSVTVAEYTPPPR